MAEASQSTEIAITDTDTNATTSGQEQESGFLGGIGGVDVLRQVTLIIALVLCVGIAFTVVMLASEPDWRPIAAKLSDKDLIETMDFLDAQKVKHKLDGRTIFVVAEDYERVKLLMMRQGLEQGDSADMTGTGIILKDMGFGVSQRLEQARLKLSLETQIAAALERLNDVAKAKVLLAIPKEQVFARRSKSPSATVVLTVKRGRSMSDEEIDSVADVTASAVQGLEPSRVTVTDQNGRLLNSGSQNSMSSRARKEYEIELKREQEYTNKVERILIPVIGLGRYTAQVDVTMDFSRSEETQKSFNPDLLATRSENLIEDTNVGGLPIGIPGALTNQPPLNSNIPENAQSDEKQTMIPGSTHKQTTRNYEVDTTVSHRKSQVGVVQRLTVSVALDYIEQMNANGEMAFVTRSEEELISIRRLLQGSIGFDPARGDVIEVVSIPFTRDELTPESSVPWYQLPIVERIIRYAFAALVLLVLILTVMKPMINKLINPESTQDDFEEDSFTTGLDLGDETLDMLNKEFDAGSVGFSPDGTLQLPDLHGNEDLLKAVRALVANEPELSSQVVKAWLSEDD